MAAGLQTPAQWQAWSHAPFLPAHTVGDVALENFPAISRRRLSMLGKMAVAVADQALGHSAGALDATPIVWASRYGDAQRSLDLLHTQAQGEPLSPTAFGLSVHNGIAAQHSIARKVHANGLCLAAGRHTAEAGVTEALGLLADGAPQVLLVCYDAPLPDPYDRFHDEPLSPYAWAWLLTHAGGAPAQAYATLTLETVPDEEVAPAPSTPGLPHGLQVLQYMLSGSGGVSARWRWAHAKV